MDELIRRVLKVEDEAKAIAAQGERDAAAVLEYATREARRIREQARARAEEGGGKLLDTAIAAAREAAKKSLAKAAEDAQRLAATNPALREEAVQYAIDTLAPAKQGVDKAGDKPAR